MTRTASRPSRLTAAEAQAWMEAHRHELAGLPTEVEGVKVIGKLDHPVLGDGWGSFTWQVGGIVWHKDGSSSFRSERSIKHTRAGAKKRTAPADRSERLLADFDFTLPQQRKLTAQEWKDWMSAYKRHIRDSRDHGVQSGAERHRSFETPIHQALAVRIAVKGGDPFIRQPRTYANIVLRAQAQAEIARYGRLRETTRTVDTEAPDLWDGLHISKETQRRHRFVSLREAEAVAVFSQQSVEELREVLAQTLTEKELDALERSAAGEAQEDVKGNRIRRARVKAGKIIIRGGWRASAWTTV